MDEGYIKYQCNWIQGLPINPDYLQEINPWRDKLYQLGLIGIYDNGIGFGNLSIRYNNSEQFIISGTQTGHLPNLTNQHYTIVTDFDIDHNCLTCTGPIKASSESLTHAAVYQANPQVNAIIHIHHLQLWQQLLNQVPTTNPNCAYGTPEMAKEIFRLCQQEHLQEKRILVMSGHEEGIITFGHNLAAAGDVLLEYFSKEILG